MGRAWCDREELRTPAVRCDGCQTPLHIWLSWDVIRILAYASSTPVDNTVKIVLF
jgi:hypothetical protein